jgi:hypothetical protein
MTSFTVQFAHLPLTTPRCSRKISHSPPKHDSKSPLYACISQINFSSSETVKPTRVNRISRLQSKTSQFHSFCETVKLYRSLLL